MNESSNIYAGWEILWHEFRMMWKMISKLIYVVAILQVITWALITTKMVSALNLEIAWKFYAAQISTALFLQPVFHLSGGIGAITTHDLISSSIAQGIAASTFSKSVYAGKLSFGIYLLFPLVLFIIKWRANKEMNSKHIRGMQIQDDGELKKQLHKAKGLLPFGTIMLPRKYESEHVFIGGKPRVGKSVLVKQQLEAIIKSGARCAIGDFKGEYTELFYRPGKDFIMNPLDERGVSWNLFSEIQSKADANAICDSLIPDSNGNGDPFWITSAKSVFRGILSALYVKGKRTNADLWKACTSPIENILALCQSTPAGASGYSCLQDPKSKMAAGIVAVMVSYVSWLEFAQDSRGDEFSVNKFLKSNGGLVFLTGRPEVESTLKPYTGLFLDLLCRRILSLPDAEHEPRRKTFVVLDEFGNLQKLPSIIRFATAAGSKGGCLTIAIQDFAAIVRIYGKESAETLFNAAGTAAIFNVADPATAEYFSKRFGKYEYEYAQKNYRMSSKSASDGLTISRQTKEKDLISPAEIQSLPKLEFYLKVPEHNPARLKLGFQAVNNRKPAEEAFILRSGFSMDDVVDIATAIVERADVFKQTVPVPILVASEQPKQKDISHIYDEESFVDIVDQDNVSF